MKIRILRNLGKGEPKKADDSAYQENEVADVEQKVAEDLVKRGLAEQVDEAQLRKERQQEEERARQLGQARAASAGAAGHAQGADASRLMGPEAKPGKGETHPTTKPGG